MDTRVALLFTIAILNVIFGYLVSRNSREITRILFTLLTIAVSFWALNVGLFTISENLNHSLIYANIFYISAAAIPLIFFLFARYYPEEGKKFASRDILYVIPLLIIILGFTVNKNLLIESVYINECKCVDINMVTYSLYVLYFLFYFIASYYTLGKKVLNKKYVSQRRQMLLIITGTLITVLLGMYFNLFLPIVDYSQIWLGPLFTVVMVASVAYSTIRHGLFSVRIVTAEVVTFITGGVLISKLLFSASFEETVVNILLFVSTVLFGIVVIASVHRDAAIRSTIERLVSQLNTANSHLIHLDQQKSDFISIASHQLRTPLTAIKGYASLLLEESFGKIPKKTVEPIHTIFASSQRLVKTVENFLALSRIEQGRMQYSFEVVDMKDLISRVIQDVAKYSKDRRVKMNFTRDARRRYDVSADYTKMRHALTNIIDSALQHTEDGLIDISLFYTINNNIRLAISDTGEGAPRNELIHLFDRYDSVDSFTSHNTYDLYVAREIIDAHGGAVRAESQGPGHGLTVFVELKPVEMKK